jgi:uncharacterized protein
MNNELEVQRERVIELAKRYGLKELALFGSVLSDRFGPESDIDVLIEFLPEVNASLYDLVDIKAELESLFDRKVDVVEKSGLRNPFRRRAILSNYEVIYAA